MLSAERRADKNQLVWAVQFSVTRKGSKMDDSSLGWDMSGKPVAAMNGIDPYATAIKMAAVGRRFRLGQFYDYRTDAILPECFWSAEQVRMATEDDDHPKLQVKQYGMEEWSSRWEHGGLCHHLHASVMADLIGKYRGASAYLADECDMTDALRTLRVRYTSRASRIDLNSLASANLDREPNKHIPEEATHLVVGIKYGVEAFNLFSGPVSREECKEDVEEDMATAIKDMIDALYGQEEPSEFEQRSAVGHVIRKLSCKHYSDLQACPRDVRFTDAFRLNCKMLETAKKHPDQVVALSVVLLPIANRSLSHSNISSYQDIASSSLDNCRAVFDQLSRRRAQVQGWLKNDKVKVFQEFRNSLRQFIDCTGKFRAMVQDALKRTVPQSRQPSADDDEDDPVVRVVENASGGTFSEDAVRVWVQRKEAEMEILQMVGQLEGVSVVQVRSKLDEELLSSQRRNVLVLKIPPLVLHDQLLAEMKTYVTNNKRLVKSKAVTISNQLPWFMGNDAKEDMLRILGRLREHVRENPSSQRVAFLATSLLSQANSSRSRFCLYRGGRCVDDDYQLPDSPYDVVVVERTETHISLRWQCFASVNVSRFVVQCTGRSGQLLHQLTTNSNETRAQLAVAHSKGDVSIQVAAETSVGRTAFSSDCEQATRPKKGHPPALRVARLTHNSIQLAWTEPVHSEGMSIAGYRISYHPKGHEAQVKHLDTNGTTCLLVGLTSQVAYVVRALADYGPDGPSAVSEPLICSPSTLPLRLADSLKSRCARIGRVNGLELLLVPVREKPSRSQFTKRFVFGDEHSDQKNRKTILLVGATGSGKTTLINGLINYIFGVQWGDPFRFKLIHEQGASQAHSQTNCVAAYDIHWHPGMNIPYSLTIVDTPGYGDTKGLDRDKQITDIIEDFFKDPDGIQELDAVGFVSQASLPRLTPTQVYIFDSVLSIFGNDIGDNISLLLTFADSQLPPVLSAIAKKPEMPCPKDASGQPLHHKFNNSGFFASNAQTAPAADHFNAHFWNMGMDNFAKFFVELNKMETKSLSLTRQVLEERKQLETTVEGLQPLIQRGLVKMEELRKTKSAIANSQALIDANANVEIEVEVTEAQMVDISSTGHFLTNCSKCHVTCHYPCAYQRDEDKKRCSAMTDGVCRICPEKCVWNIHFNQPYRWQYVTVKKIIQSEELKRNYETLQRKKLTAQGLIETLERELLDIEAQVLRSVNVVAQSIERLQAIALRPNPFSSPQYIDLMISSEQQNKKPGFKERVDSLRKLRQQADITSRISAGQSLFTSSAPPTAAPAADPATVDVPFQSMTSITEEKFQNLF